MPDTRCNDRYQARLLGQNFNSNENSLSRVVKKERMTQQDADAAISLISTSTEKTSAADADLVVEAIPEIPELKFSTFAN